MPRSHAEPAIVARSIVAPGASVDERLCRNEHAVPRIIARMREERAPRRKILAGREARHRGAGRKAMMLDLEPQQALVVACAWIRAAVVGIDVSAMRSARAYAIGT